MRIVCGLAPFLFYGLAASALAQGETACPYLCRSLAAPAVTPALHERQRGAAALRAAADAWTAAPPSVEIGTRSDRFNRRNGAREMMSGRPSPLAARRTQWQPGTRPAAERRRGGRRGEMQRLRPGPGAGRTGGLAERPQRVGAGRRAGLPRRPACAR